MTVSDEAHQALRDRHVFPHALWMEDSLVSPPCALLLVHPDTPLAEPSEQVFGFYDLADDELQQAMQVCVGRVMRCVFLEPGVQQCRVEVAQDGRAKWFRHDGVRFKQLNNENQKSEGDPLRPPREG